MPVFAYRAADRRGQTIDGVMEAPDARAVVERLRKDAYFPIKVAAQGERRRLGLAWPDRRLAACASRDLLALTQQLATLFEAGLPLDRALAILEELAPTPRVRTIVTDLLHSVRGGSSLARRSPSTTRGRSRASTSTWCGRARRAACSRSRCGGWPSSWRRAAAFNEALVSALAYPAAVITGVGAAAIVFLMTFVIPRFATIFNDLGQTIPLPTQILLRVSAAHAALLVGAARSLAMAGVLAWRIVDWRRRRAGSRGTSSLLRLPIVGALVLKIETARFARTLGTMLKSGVPVLGALAVVGDMLANQALGARGRAAGRRRQARRHASRPADARAHARFPPLAVHMVRVGEETGRLEEMLLKVADDVRDRRSQLSSSACSAARARHHPGHGGARGLHRRGHAAGHLLHQRDPAMRAAVTSGSCRNQRGFTLIELLVVIIMLGLLVGPRRAPALRPRRARPSRRRPRRRSSCSAPASTSTGSTSAPIRPRRASDCGADQNPTRRTGTAPISRRPPCPNDPWGKPVPVPVLPRRARRLRPLDGGRRRRARAARARTPTSCRGTRE